MVHLPRLLVAFRPFKVEESGMEKGEVFDPELQNKAMYKKFVIQ